MSGLVNFIITEGLKVRSVLALHRFDNVKHHVTKDLERHLFTAWKAAARSLKLHVDKEQAEDASFKNPKALTAIEVTDKPTKLYTTAETGRVKQVSPAVKLPLLLSDADRQVAREKLFDAAAETFKLVLDTWSEVFIHEKAGQAHTDFCVKRDARSVRLCLTALEKGVEHETLLYHITLEHGKVGSKVRDHDTIFLSVDR